MQHLPTTNGESVDRCHHGLGDIADKPLEVLILEDSVIVWPVVTCLFALLLIPTGAKSPLAGACQRHHPDIWVTPGNLETVDQLVDRLSAKCIHPVGPVDRDPGEAAIYGVGHVFE
ncbi:unannotated protein [freshwater metagenome]|uniref:Unannotated protein n=1 Tax=freshwater metagenome TaxID=449393 RepID=A0A6J7QE57_9ZZZZ